jgi:hypothetical protein
MALSKVDKGPDRRTVTLGETVPLLTMKPFAEAKVDGSQCFRDDLQRTKARKKLSSLIQTHATRVQRHSQDAFLAVARRAQDLVYLPPQSYASAKPQLSHRGP